MPRTRSAQRAALKDAAQSNDDPSGLAESASTPPKSFQGQLDKFEYAAADQEEQDGAEVTDSAPKSTKRARVVTKSESAAYAPPGKKRKSSSYAAPSKYAHLSPLVDIIEPNLICIFIGFNPVSNVHLGVYH